jgi:hypothetical protein
MRSCGEIPCPIPPFDQHNQCAHATPTSQQKVVEQISTTECESATGEPILKCMISGIKSRLPTPPPGYKLTHIQDAKLQWLGEQIELQIEQLVNQIQKECEQERMEDPAINERMIFLGEQLKEWMGRFLNRIFGTKRTRIQDNSRMFQKSWIDYDGIEHFLDDFLVTHVVNNTQNAVKKIVNWRWKEEKLWKMED